MLLSVALVTVPGLGSGFVDLRLLIDPNLDTVNVKVNGVDKGTYVYNTLSPPHDDRFASIGGVGGAAQFDRVSIRVGGTAE